MQVENFLRLQPLTYIGGPNPDTAEHWIHEIERVFVMMRCPPVDRVVLAAYQLRGFAQEWWRLKMQTIFAGRTEETITWPEFLDVFNDTFFLVQVHQAKREQFRTLQQGNSSVLEYQMRFMTLSRYAPYVVSDNAMMVEYFIRGLRAKLQNAVIPKGASGSIFLRFQQVGTKVEEGIPRSRGKRRSPTDVPVGAWLQVGGGGVTAEYRQAAYSSTRVQGHLIRNCPYPQEYGYGRGVQQQQHQPSSCNPFCSARGGAAAFCWVIRRFGGAFGVFSPQGPCVERGKRRESVVLRILHEGRGILPVLHRLVSYVHVVDVRFHMVCAVCTWFVCTWRVVRRLPWLSLQFGAPGSV
ncbi:hypothetical protein Taro_026801 [Colocasia esculenta]|uniref:Retrotransposon gag domain-containing protein n=1 Tax=Colocasia esculenta TaxID=4460 RepID=A0A843VCV3_COLES|nr:hypothetical protein [Colocasia esculenta]